MALHRYARCRAVASRGADLAGLLLEVADGLAAFPGCGMYIVNRAVDDPDEVWVTELWENADVMRAALRTPESQAMIPRVMELVAEWGEPVELIPLGGPGLP